MLTGGHANRGAVVRIGSTVHRPQRETSAATHALLAHLHHVGFNGAPRLLGVDEVGDEVLSYVDGDAATPPFADWALTDDALVSVALLLRQYHDAVADFDHRPFRWPRPCPEPFRTGLVSHNDPKPENVIFRSGTAAALIDFDLASPGSREWDVANAARLWSPLRDDRDITDSRQGRGLARFRIFVDAYGLPAASRRTVASAVPASHHWGYDPVRQGAAAAHPGFSRYWTEVSGRAERAAEWYRKNAAALQAALL